MNDFEAIQNAIQALCGQLKEELPPPRSAFGGYADQMVDMDDGVQLATRVFTPQGAGPWPVVLVRNPYTPVNKAEFMQQGFLLFLLYGYAVVYQQVRGVFDSQGEWLAFEQERRDSLAAVRWTEAQDFCNGSIGTYGGSYLGHVQWCMADAVPPSVKTMYISVYGGQPYDLFYENGMFKQGTWTLWASQMMGVRGKTDLSRHDPDTYQKAMAVLPAAEMDTQLYGCRAPWYQSWLASPDAGNSYWTKGAWGRVAQVAGRVSIPIMLQGGWYDIFLASALETYKRLPQATRAKSRLLIGPWHHGNQPGGDILYPGENQFGAFQLKDALLWFDTHLQGRPYPYPVGEMVAYSVREDVWRHFTGSGLPCGQTRRFYLDTGDGEGGGMALRQQPAVQPCSAGYTYDPAQPVPSLGGNLLAEDDAPGGLPRCTTPQPAPGWRQDVLSFVSPVLEQPLHLSGSARVRLHMATSAEDTCFTVKLMEVDPQGVARNIRDGAMALSFWAAQQGVPLVPGQPLSFELSLCGILWKLQPGCRLRLDISSSNYPAFHRHPNKAGLWSLQAGFETARQTIYTGAGCDAWLELPCL